MKIIHAYIGRNEPLLVKKNLPNKGKKNIHNIAKAINITPNNLFVTERSIAYNGKKYHSGTICAGVTSGFARMKLSECPNLSGINIIKIRKIWKITIKLNISLTP